jgi:hypothetical protein
MDAPVLPGGYHVERDADLLSLLRGDGSEVARFSARGAERQEVERTPTEDALNKRHERLRRAPLPHARKPVNARQD